ncbi:hypothetical protein L9F63_019294, partial [Diploptera punctata]
TETLCSLIKALFSTTLFTVVSVSCLTKESIVYRYSLQKLQMFFKQLVYIVRILHCGSGKTFTLRCAALQPFGSNKCRFDQYCQMINRMQIVIQLLKIHF